MESSEKQVLAETMRRLIISINSNPHQQLKIFESLSKEDVLKILQNFEHSHEGIRKMSAKLITQLLYENNSIKERLLGTLHITPSDGNIILNKIPQSLVQSPDRVMEIMKVVKSSNVLINSKQLCWYVDPREGGASVRYVNPDTFGITEFVDPFECIFGFSYIKLVPQVIEVPTLMFKEADIPERNNKYYVKTQPVNASNQKPKFTFSSRQRGNTMIQQHQPSSRTGEFSFRGNRNQAHNICAATDRTRLEDKSLSPSSVPLTNSMRIKPRDSEVKSSGNKMRLGIEITSPTSVNSNPVRFKNQRSKQRKQIIVLGGNKTNNSKDLPSSANHPLTGISNTNPVPKQIITFSTSKSPTLSNYKNIPSSSTPNNNNSHKIDYMKIISQFKNHPKEETETKMYGDYKPSDDFLRKIKESIKTKD